jgi:hypothetical protein
MRKQFCHKLAALTAPVYIALNMDIWAQNRFMGGRVRQINTAFSQRRLARPLEPAEYSRRIRMRAAPEILNRQTYLNHLEKRE